MNFLSEQNHRFEPTARPICPVYGKDQKTGGTARGIPMAKKNICPYRRCLTEPFLHIEVQYMTEILSVLTLTKQK